MRGVFARVMKSGNKKSPWKVQWAGPIPGRPKRKHFADRETAEAFARDLNRQIASEGTEGFYFGAEARAEYVAAKRIIGPETSLLEVAREWAARKSRPAGITWEKATLAHEEEKERGNRSPDTIRNLKQRLRAFRDFSGIETLDQLELRDVEAWLHQPGLSPASRACYRAALHDLCEFCTRRGWLPENPVAKTSRPRLDRPAPVILTPTECRALLDSCHPRILRRVAILLFAGLRPTEADKLTEKSILPDGIRVAEGKIRGRRAVRIVLLSSTLKAWLETYKAEPLHPPNFRRLYREAWVKAGIAKPQKDTLRKTWISYRLAETKDERQTAREAGNSPDIIYGYYYQLVGETDARAFRHLLPPRTH